MIELMSRPPADDSAAADRRAVLDTAKRFYERAVRPLGERPEEIPTQPQMAQLIGAAAEAGLLPDAETPGMGIWAGNEADDNLLSAEILAGAAEHCAAAAFHLHQAALGRRLAARLGLALEHPRPWLYAGAGLAKGALAAVLSPGTPGHGLSPAAVCPGPQVEGEATPLLLQAAEPWDAVVFPLWSSERRQIAWATADRRTLSLAESPHAHGLEGVVTWSAGFVERPKTIETADAVALYREMLALDAIGLVSIGLGAVRSSITAAAEYARERRQGGKLIIDHAAVRLLIGSAEADAEMAAAALKQMSSAPHRLRKILLLRSAAHPLLCRAANSALQVFGGYGYMRDFGLERAVRDNNHLRLCAGSTNDLLLTALAMEEDA